MPCRKNATIHTTIGELLREVPLEVEVAAEAVDTIGEVPDKLLGAISKKKSFSKADAIFNLF